MDFREVPNTYGKGAFTKIVSLEMAEHVGIRRYQSFLKQIYNLLDDDGIFVFQVAGIRPSWQYEDLIWLVYPSSSSQVIGLTHLAGVSS
jgi:sphingolipid C9-methyltransferase